MEKRSNFSYFAQYFHYTCTSNFRSQITCTESLVKCFCLIYVFLNSANLICQNISESSLDFNAWKGHLCNLQTTQAQVSLCIWADWSGILLPSYRSNAYYSMSWHTKNVQIRLCGWCAHSIYCTDTICCCSCQNVESLQIRLHRCTGWSGLSLIPYGMYGHFSYIFHQTIKGVTILEFPSIYYSTKLC